MRFVGGCGVRGEQFPTFDPTPRERGILAGLADKWGENPYPRGDDGYWTSREYDEYAEGFEVGQALLRGVEAAA